MSPGNKPAQRDCPVRDVLDRVGDKWSVFVVTTLREGPKRFSELKRAIEGISQRMLTRTLRGLERDGLVRRTVYASVPPAVEYALTDRGETLLGPITALFEWAEANGRATQTARDLYDSEHPADALDEDRAVAAPRPARAGRPMNATR